MDTNPEIVSINAPSTNEIPLDLPTLEWAVNFLRDAYPTTITEKAAGDPNHAARILGNEDVISTLEDYIAYNIKDNDDD